MPIFYATKIDKNGDKLTTGYLTSKNRARYAAGAAFADTEIFANIENETLVLYNTEHTDLPKGYLLRGMIVNNNGVANTSAGRFVLLGKRDGSWNTTGFSFPDFSAGNSFMKSMVSSYQALALVDIEGSSNDSVPAVESDLSIGD